jgi:hypothetical protein
MLASLLAAGKTLLGLGTKAAGLAPWWVWPMAGLALWAIVQTARLGTAHVELAQAEARYRTELASQAEYQKRITQAAADANRKALDDLKAWQVLTEAAQAARLARLQSDNDDLNRRLEAIDHAPDDHDGAVAPVLCDSLVGLHLASACTAAGAAAGGPG